MRTLAIALTVGMAVGCAGNDVAFQHESTLADNTRGLVIENDQVAQAGMFSNTCAIDIQSAMIGQDVDIAESDDEVEDTSGGVVLVRGTDGLHIYEPDGFDWGWEYTPDVPGNDIIDGALIDGGVIAVRDTAQGLGVDWSGDLTGSAAVPGNGLTGLAVDRESGTVFVAADGAVDAASADGTTNTIDAGDLVVWDSTANVLYIADAGGSELRGVEADGGLRWAAEIDGDISAIETLNGSAIVSVARNQSGALVTVDGFTGEVTSSQATPGAADSLQTSESGNTVAVILARQTHFFKTRQ